LLGVEKRESFHDGQRNRHFQDFLANVGESFRSWFENVELRETGDCTC
jgi:hypothetical protein